MASSGPTAWAKYYQGRGNITTAVKIEGLAYDVQGQPTSTRLAAGTPVTVLATESYDPRPRIEVRIGGQTRTLRFRFDSLVKPGNRASQAVSLKPQAFGVVGPAMQLATYKKRALDTLEERRDLPGQVKSYLMLLIEYWSGTNDARAKIEKLWPQIRNQVPLNDINKDFGEVLGPLAVIKRGLLANTVYKSDINVNSPIYIPARPNEPLMDYKVGPVVISAKSGVTTNTVKPRDILDLLNKNAASRNSYARTREYRVLELLADNTALAGPVLAVQYLLGQQYSKWLSSNAYLAKNKQGKYTGNELMYECEKYIQAASRTGNLNYTKMFADAIRNNVVYVKFTVGVTDGVGDFETIVSDDIGTGATVRPYLRSKNGYTRASDKMGIQI